MRILHTEASSGWGGQEIRILREALGLCLRGHEVFIAAMKGSEIAKKARGVGLKVYEMNFRKPLWLFTLFRLFFVIKREGIEIVNTHSSLDAWIAGIAARLCGVRLIRTRHLSTQVKKGKNARWIYGKLADFVVTTCASIIGSLSQNSGKPLGLFRSIPTGVDPKELEVTPEETARFRKKLGIEKSDFLVGTACVMRSWKGIDDLIRAAWILREKPHIKVALVGGGHVARHIALVKRLKLEDKVLFTGHLSPPYAAIASFDVFALLSTASEGVSQAILQAAYLKRALIATKTGGLQEVCIDGISGMSVPIHSPEKIAEAILALEADRALGKKYGENAYHLVKKRFLFEKTLDEMERVFAEKAGSNLG